MTLEEALKAKIEMTAGISALVGTRIYPNVIPQDAALPAMAYQRIDGPRIKAHDGALYARGRIQITVRATTYGGAKAVFHALRATFDGFKGLMGGTAGVIVWETSVENELDGYNTEAGYSTVRMDLNFLYQE